MKRYQLAILNCMVICAITQSAYASTIIVATSGGDYPTVQAGVTAANAQESLIDIGADETGAAAVFPLHQTLSPASKKPPVIAMTHGRPTIYGVDPSTTALLFSMDGRCVRPMTDNTAGTISIDRAGMGKGTYVLRIMTVSGTKSFLLPTGK